MIPYNKMNCFKLTFVFAIALTLSEPVWSICDTLEHIDKGFAFDIQFFGNRAQKAISNDAAYKEDCGKYEKSVQAISDFIANCLTSIPKSMGSIIIKSLKAHYDKRCNNAEFAAQFIEHNKCFENAAIFEKFHLCSDRWYHQMQALKGLNQDTPTAIKSSCCILHDFQRCVRDNNRNECHDKNAKFWDDVIDEVADDHKDEFCAQLKTSEQCEANFPKETWDAINGGVSQMSDAALKEHTGKFKSSFFTLLDMAAQYKLQ